MVRWRWDGSVYLSSLFVDLSPLFICACFLTMRRPLRGRQEEVLTQPGVHEQTSCTHNYSTYKGSALMLAVRNRKTGMVEKLLAAGAKAGTTDEVH